ncbi:glycoside hydrolase [Halomicrococcus sp. SG-WS-1]|uniref:glycoside hydrolase n=1 Tax=Halomicrococcus sp. SG-WS-1 TaxID=3439057 RepID=UPI003F78BB90
MVRRSSRRRFLAACATGASVLGGCIGAGMDPPPVDVRGAMYLPARAFNTYQMWGTYEPGVTERDLRFADRLNLNAVRVWLNYEAWNRDPEGVGRALDHFLKTADDHDIRVVLGIFEGVGRPPIPKNLHDTDPWTAPSVFSPRMVVMKNRDRWDGPRQFVRWVMDRHRDDDRLLAIEVMNEPGWRNWKKRFARAMFEVTRQERGRIPLTIGATSLANAAEYYDWGIDVVQFHYNFAGSQATFRDVLQQAVDLRESTDTPVWLSEWQRVVDFAWREVPVLQRGPNYSSLAPLIRETGVGNFFWSLMLKPAYMLGQRRRGILNGVFHEDGAVWSSDDARAIKSMSGEETFEGEQRREWPDWAAEVKRRV